MSIYYALACDVCRKQTDFVKTSIAGHGWMADATKNVPDFFSEHASCGINGGNALRIMSEYDEDWGEYEDFPTEDATTLS